MRSNGSVDVKFFRGEQAAIGICRGEWHPEVLPLHMRRRFLLEDREGLVIPVLDKFGVPVEQFCFRGETRRLLSFRGARRRNSRDESALQRSWSRGFKEAKL